MYSRLTVASAHNGCPLAGSALRRSHAVPPLFLLVVRGDYVADSVYGWDSESNWLSALCLVNLSFHFLHWWNGQSNWLSLLWMYKKRFTYNIKVSSWLHSTQITWYPIKFSENTNHVHFLKNTEISQVCMQCLFWDQSMKNGSVHLPVRITLSE